MRRVVGRVVMVVIILVAAAGVSRALGNEPALNETQVKSLFLINFAKYVDWPPVAFDGAAAPIVIGLWKDDKFSEVLGQTVERKHVGGRRIVFRLIAAGDDTANCHILFIRDAQKTRLGEILGKTQGLPVLTVGEMDQFLESGGVINFVKKEGKVRLEINLAAARQAGLGLSSKLLSVADVVIGKAN